MLSSRNFHLLQVLFGKVNSMRPDIISLRYPIKLFCWGHQLNTSYWSLFYVECNAGRSSLNDQKKWSNDSRSLTSFGKHPWIEERCSVTLKKILVPVYLEKIWIFDEMFVALISPALNWRTGLCKMHIWWLCIHSSKLNLDRFGRFYFTLFIPLP